MAYYLRRPNASKYDLSGDQYDWYLRCEQLVGVIQRSHIIKQQDIVQLIQDYGKKDGGKCVYDAINYSRGLGHWSLDSLEKMLKGEIPTERHAPSQPNRPAPQAQRTGGGPRSVQDFLGEHAPPRAKKPTPEGRFKLPEVERWLAERGIHIKDAHDYFTFFGVDTAGNELWTLLPQHLQPTAKKDNGTD